MFEFIDKIVYINLEHRLDRNSEILDVLKDIPSEKVQRFNAIKHFKGNIGCTQSHIAVLELAISQRWKNVLIVEDDAVWNDFTNGYSILEKLVQNPYDVITLGTTFTKYDPDTYKLLSGLTTTAYIVNQHYYPILLDNFKRSLHGLLQTGIGQLFALDVYWRKLQAADNWYCVMPPLMIQREGYSDIEKRNVNYDCYFLGN